ncbi:hypothetical protein QOU61_36025 [Bradyrhizobium sp. NP1]|nr:hypothetical protein [Bradyrhizobium sp. NP1]WJR81980.1 hypothetical protein QOU61_36025 [Bradyrhizobium sp. NP1]
MAFVIRSRLPALLVASTLGPLLQPSLAHAQWWSRGPADFEECADAAEKAPTKQEKTSKLAECNAKFAGRRKPGGGYAYYDFMQDRTFDIAGPNPTPEEQHFIDEQYTVYLEKQRRSNIAAAFSARQQQQQQQQQRQQQQLVQPASFKGETEKIPVPQQRPKVLPSRKDCLKNAFSCEWPRLSEGLNEIKRMFTASPTTKPKKG